MKYKIYNYKFYIMDDLYIKQWDVNHNNEYGIEDLIILYWNLTNYNDIKLIISSLDLNNKNIRIYDDGIVINDYINTKCDYFHLSFDNNRGLTQHEYNKLNIKFKKKYKLDIADLSIMKKHISNIKTILEIYLIKDIINIISDYDLE